MIQAGLPELGQRVGELREGQLVRQPSEGRRDRGSHAGRFAGRDRVAGDPIARMRPEVAAQTPSGDKQAAHVPTMNYALWRLRFGVLPDLLLERLGIHRTARGIVGLILERSASLERLCGRPVPKIRELGS